MSLLKVSILIRRNFSVGGAHFRFRKTRTVMLCAGKSVPLNRKHSQGLEVGSSHHFAQHFLRLKTQRLALGHHHKANPIARQQILDVLLAVNQLNRSRRSSRFCPAYRDLRSTMKCRPASCARTKKIKSPGR